MNKYPILLIVHVILKVNNSVNNIIWNIFLLFHFISTHLIDAFRIIKSKHVCGFMRKKLYKVYF